MSAIGVGMKGLPQVCIWPGCAYKFVPSEDRSSVMCVDHFTYWNTKDGDERDIIWGELVRLKAEHA